MGPPGVLRAGAGTFVSAVFPQAARGQSGGRNPFRGKFPPGAARFLNGTRNVEPHIAVIEAGARTTGDIMGAWVEMHARHRHRRRGLRLQTRRHTLMLRARRSALG